MEVMEQDMKKTKRKPGYESGSYRVQVRLDEAWRQAVEAAAAKDGVSVSEWVRSAIAASLPKREAAKLPEMMPGRPTLGD